MTTNRPYRGGQRRPPELLDVERLDDGRTRPVLLPRQQPGRAWLLARDAAARSAGVRGRADLVPHIAGRPAPAHLIGRCTGWQAPDGAAGWRLDYDPGSKGVHVNWWRRVSGVLHRGAVRVPGADEAFFFSLLRSHFPSQELEVNGRRADPGRFLPRVEQVALRLPPERRVPYLAAWLRRLERIADHGWQATRLDLPDGSTAFVGRLARNARVVDPHGNLWRIDAGDPRQLRPGLGPDYTHPAVQRVLSVPRVTRG
jgi:hypothetical protein